MVGIWMDEIAVIMVLIRGLTAFRYAARTQHILSRTFACDSNLDKVPAQCNYPVESTRQIDV